MLSPALLSDWKPDGCNSPVGITDNLYFYDLVLNGYPQTAALEKEKKKNLYTRGKSMGLKFLLFTAAVLNRAIRQDFTM